MCGGCAGYCAAGGGSVRRHGGKWAEPGLLVGGDVGCCVRHVEGHVECDVAAGAEATDGDAVAVELDLQRTGCLAAFAVLEDGLVDFVADCILQVDEASACGELRLG